MNQFLFLNIKETIFLSRKMEKCQVIFPSDCQSYWSFLTTGPHTAHYICTLYNIHRYTMLKLLGLHCPKREETFLSMERNATVKTFPWTKLFSTFFSFHGEKSKDQGKHYLGRKEIVRCFLLWPSPCRGTLPW